MIYYYLWSTWSYNNNINDNNNKDEDAYISQNNNSFSFHPYVDTLKRVTDFSLNVLKPSLNYYLTNK